ncbi:aromatic ring-hydroxylating dioxygenase subunit alpha [Luteolibacter arcticus]|uniref:Aromatic ring-hydroxylating dioxygenase subunit alpha n=1 Tax=Luteolibacter arcticus TaxID=1581411 RepID=A0ABT3GFA9_9BACT|nr:aromatic ring-hydroxylating dioxygenase subunit alpha [Luteolibacter arcticus]MCW1922302.1 aromatic ring-hydroxylating dioxygenase subunit alpha [Luteolibacter arcticus]
MLRGHWYIACRSPQIGRGPVARTVLGEPLVIFRGQDGKAAALIDRCAHRNLALSRGKVTADGLRCAYHGWSWGSDGHCTKIPSACEPDACQAIRVKSYPVKEHQGFIWVWMGEEKEVPTHEPLHFPWLGEAGWRHFVMERVFEANAFHCVENFLDVPHTAHVHRGLFRGEESKEIEIEVTSGEDWIEGEFLGEERMDSWIGKLLVPEGSRIRHVDRFQLPYVTRVDYRMSETRQYVVMSQCTPETEDRTRVFTYLGFRFEPFGGLIRLVFQPFAGAILNQDVEVLRQQTEDLRRTGAPRFLYHETDAIARGIRELLDGKSLAGRPPERKRLRV